MPPDMGTTLARRLLENVTKLLPAPRRMWGAAMLAEIEAMGTPSGYRAFALSAAFGVCRIVVRDARRGRLADPGVLIAASLLGMVTAVVDVSASTRTPLCVLLGCGVLALGAGWPEASWRWGVLAALALPLVASVRGAAGPYTHDPADVWYPLPASLLLAVIGGAIGRRMRRLWHAPLVVVLVASAAGTGALNAQTLTHADVESFADSFFAAYVSRSAEPSLAVIVVHADAVLFEKGYGWEDQKGRRAVDPDATLFHVASISKLITATGVMQLVERGVLDLDADVTSYLRAGTIGGRAAQPITLRHLLTHTSGLDGPFMRDVVAHPSELVPLAVYFARHPLTRARPPGREIRYSNGGMALAGHVVEIASGVAFEDYVDRNILQPLGMRRSTFRQPPPAGLQEHIATAGAGIVPDALLVYPSGSLVSTAADMGRFMRAHLRGGELNGARILEPTTVSAMHATQWRAHPRQPGVALGFFESDIAGQPGLFHTGARVHFSLLYLVPERDIGIFVVHAMRQGGEFQSLRSDFVRAFLARFMAGDSAAHPALRNVESRQLREYAAVYRPRLVSSSTIERAAWLALDAPVRTRADGTLILRVPGGPQLRFAMIEPDLFRVEDGARRGMMLSFRRSPAGMIVGMAMSGITQDPVSFDRLAWFQRGRVHAAVLACAFLLFLGCAVVAVGAPLVRRLRGHPAPPRAGALQRTAWAMARATTALVVCTPVTIAVLVLTHTGDDTAADGLRRALGAGLTMLLAAAVLGMTLIPFAVVAWRRTWWTLHARFGYTLLAIAVAVATPLLLWYRLLGYWY